MMAEDGDAREQRRQAPLRAGLPEPDDDDRGTTASGRQGLLDEREHAIGERERRNEEREGRLDAREVGIADRELLQDTREQLSGEREKRLEGIQQWQDIRDEVTDRRQKMIDERDAELQKMRRHLDEGKAQSRSNAEKIERDPHDPGE